VSEGLAVLGDARQMVPSEEPSIAPVKPGIKIGIDVNFDASALAACYNSVSMASGNALDFRVLGLAPDLFDLDNRADALRFADGDPARAREILDAMWDGNEKQARDPSSAIARAKELCAAREERERAHAVVYRWTII
jgi:hypothetical protein